MTTVCITLLVIVALVALSFFWDWRQSGRMLCAPIPRPYRDQDSQQAMWRRLYGEILNEADAVLTLVWRSNGRWRSRWSTEERTDYSQNNSRLNDILKTTQESSSLIRFNLIKPRKSSEVFSTAFIIASKGSSSEWYTETRYRTILASNSRAKGWGRHDTGINPQDNRTSDRKS